MGLEDKVNSIKGIGPTKATALKKLKIESIEDLLYYYPRDYEDRRELKKITELVDGETALLRGNLRVMVKGKFSPRRKQTLKLLIQDETGVMEVVFFNAAYLNKTLVKDGIYEFFGKATVNNGRVQMLHPEFTKYENDNQQIILPVYPLIKGLTQSDLRKCQFDAHNLLPELIDYLPQDTIERNRLCSIQYAIENIHFPKDKQKLKEARYRLIFEELLLLQTGLFAIKNKLSSKERGIQFSNDIRMEEYTSGLAYKLTGAQRRVLSEINEDMESIKVMNRLVQGDVGSGKTVIAAAAIFKAVNSGYQAVMMAPTELLAKQHFDTLKNEFDKYGMKTGFLASSISAKDKKSILEQIENGKLDIIIGTHAIIQPNVNFLNLGLVITDEQHRFGVNQRYLLSKKGENPDIIVMTATPIPRTLAVILYGDLDISIIDEMPPGRQQIITRSVNSQGREASYEFLRREVKKGRQAYIVVPLKEESEILDVKSATGLYDEVKEKFNGFKLAFLHGGMKQLEKDEIMKEFYEGIIDILISTVVIEVGINVPNATMMLIENAERFGLSQLHQLRGRVGRGSEQSFCILITEGKTEMSKERAEIMMTTNDGFIIAEKDLELRGPGEFFGMRQHGVPDLKLADLVKHNKILKDVREEANIILNNDEFLTNKNNQLFKNKIDKMFHDTTSLNI